MNGVCEKVRLALSETRLPWELKVYITRWRCSSIVIASRDQLVQMVVENIANPRAFLIFFKFSRQKAFFEAYGYEFKFDKRKYSGVRDGVQGNLQVLVFSLRMNNVVLGIDFDGATHRMILKEIEHLEDMWSFFINEGFCKQHVDNVEFLIHELNKRYYIVDLDEQYEE